MKASPLVNLGADRVRMKDQRDVDRQQATVEHLLRRFYAENADEQYELQVVADEVGMGKTFVALATAFAMLEQRRENHEEQDNASVHVLVLVPNNDALFKKWKREAGEFVKRCVGEENRAEVEKRFRAKTVERLDELAAALCHRDGPELVLAKTSALAGRVKHFDAKARLVLATAFRVWGNAFRLDARERLLRGAEKWQWPADPREFAALAESSRASNRFAKAWARLPSAISPQQIHELWSQPELVAAREQLEKIADLPGALAFGQIDSAVESGARGSAWATR